MAGRTSSSVGVGIAIAILSVLTLAFFILATVFYGQLNTARTQVKTNDAAVRDFIRPDERQRDDVARVVETAKSNNQSLVGYMLESQAGTMQTVTGSRSESLESLKKRLEGVKGADTNNLLSVISSRDSLISSQEEQNAKLEAARVRALEDLKAAEERVKTLQAQHQQTVDALGLEVNTYKQEGADYRQRADQWKADMDAKLERERNEAADAQKGIQKQLDRANEDILILKNTIATLRDEKSKDLFRGQDEFALVDGSVISVNSGAGQCTISVGANKRVVLGMSFAVYVDSAAIRPDSNTNEYPVGKATIEVINVGETSSTCRIIREARGNPVVAGDVIANAVYDPNKVYKFVVFGNFDANRDGLATPAERTDISAVITAWGGKVIEDLTGDVDFLVLGERPVLPPRPGADQPIEVQQEWIRLDRQVQRYGQLYEQARQTGVPVLNENRLYTLIGKPPGAIR